jgi:hypothetical protein
LSRRTASSISFTLLMNLSLLYTVGPDNWLILLQLHPSSVPIVGDSESARTEPQ